MTAKNKIEKYVKNITKNDTYVDYLTKAAEFGYHLRDAEIEEMKKVIRTYEDMLENDDFDY